MQTSQKVIDQFMWGYQEHYYSALKSFAEKYFNSIFPGVYNQVLIVGTLLSGKDSKNKVCIQQEDDFYKQSDFQDVDNLALQLQQISPENYTFYDHPDLQESHQRAIKVHALRDAIKKCIEKKEASSICVVAFRQPC